MKRLLFAAIAIAALEPRRAEACTCGNLYRLVAPADAATDVPTNAVIQIQFSFEPVVELRVATTGALVPLELETHVGADYAGWLLARPSELAPDTSYELTITFETAPPYHSTFTTGSALHTTPPTVELRAFGPQFLVNDTNMGNSCHTQELSRFALDLETTNAALVILDVLAADRTTSLAALSLDPTEHDGVDGNTCGARAPIFTPGIEYCARARVFDVAGQLATSEARCTVAVECDWAWDETRSPSWECVPPSEPDPLEPVTESKGCAALGGGPWWLVPLFVLRRRRVRGSDPSQPLG